MPLEAKTNQGLRVVIASATALGSVGLLAAVTGLPWLFPSLGPTVLVHAEEPQTAAASPRNTLIGHATGLIAGYLSLIVFGLVRAPSALMVGVSGARVGAAALSLALTGAVLLVLGASHAPAGATTLIVSLGLLHRPGQLVVAFAGVVAVTVVDWSVMRLAGRPLPLWRVEGSSEGPGR